MTELTVEHLEVRYGDLVGIADISLRVARGQIVALLGSNGAGKTTTLNAIAGLVRPSRGRIQWHGEQISGQPAYAIVSKGLALSPEGWRQQSTGPRVGSFRPAARLRSTTRVAGSQPAELLEPC